MSQPAGSPDPSAARQGQEPRPLTAQEVDQVVSTCHDLAREGRTSDLAGFLEHGVPVNVTDPEGNTLLMLAAYHGHPETVAMLIAHDADVDRRNDRDQSPIAGSLFKGETEVVRLLRDAGADLDAGSPTAREAATMFGQQGLLGG